MEWYNVSLTPRVQSCVKKLGITLSIIGHNSRDSEISVLTTLQSAIVRYIYPTLETVV